MTLGTPAQVLAELLGVLVRDLDTTDLFADLVHDAARLLTVDAAALLVTDGRHGLELLVATSHRAAELEVDQVRRTARLDELALGRQGCRPFGVRGAVLSPAGP